MTSYPPQALRTLQKTETEMLDAFSAFCTEHDITWFLDGGSALGAVRHNGFIPWDDDIDVGMMRKDYDRFLAHAEDGLPDELELIVPGKTPGFAGTFAKVCKRGTRFWTQETLDAGFEQGIFIDVFPYDFLSSDQRIRKTQIKRATRLVQMTYLYYSGATVVGIKGIVGGLARAGCRVAHKIIHLTQNPTQLHEKFEDVRTLAYGSESDYCISLSFPYIKPVLCSTFLPPKQALFEQHLFPVPHDVEGYLESLYGHTWRDLPPVDEQRTHAPLILDFGDGVNTLAFDVE